MYLLCFILICYKISFKMRFHVTIFWNLAQGGHFSQSGKIGDTGEFLLFWNGHTRRVLGSLSKKLRMVSGYNFFTGPYYRAKPKVVLNTLQTQKSLELAFRSQLFYNFLQKLFFCNMIWIKLAKFYYQAVFTSQVIQ